MNLIKGIKMKPIQGWSSSTTYEHGTKVMFNGKICVVCSKVSKEPIPIKEYIDHHYGLEDTNQAFTNFRNKFDNLFSSINKSLKIGKKVIQ